MSNTQTTDKKPTLEIIKPYERTYIYENVPQDNPVLFVQQLICKDDAEAIREARKLNPNFNYIIVEQG